MQQASRRSKVFLLPFEEDVWSDARVDDDGDERGNISAMTLQIARMRNEPLESDVKGRNEDFEGL